jgi:deazaflavin-dependent oxidoreductase (nitroreductase family)
MGNPITGYIMLTKTVGRKTGKIRSAPVNYAIRDGVVYCMAGFGRDTHWYRNLQAQPKVEIILPNGPLAGIAENVTDPDENIQILRQLLKNSGFAGFMMGFNPYTISDNELQERMQDFPLVRIQPTGVGSGPADAGGWYWVTTILLTALVLWHIFR